jgi:oligopeptide/dipeptide ABC transporter ATP-binding protein
MYLGKIVEQASSDDIYVRPRHPYTQALVSAIPEPDPTRERTRIVLEGDVPSPIDPPSGCRFHTRCAYAAPQCRETVPALEEAGQGQFVACFRWREIESGAAKGAAGSFKRNEKR